MHPIRHTFNFILFSAIACSNVAAAQQISEQTSPSDSFVDSIGVNVHLGDKSSVYYQKYSSVIKPALANLGIRHLRDGIEGYWASDVFANINDLANSGVKFCFISDGTNATNFVNMVISKVGPTHVSAIEGINEPDITQGTSWNEIASNYQSEIFSAVKTTPALKNTRVYAPALGKNDASVLGLLTPNVDWGNFHPYMGGRNPETTGWGSNGYGSLAWNVSYMASPVSGNLPVVATECGLHNAVNTTSTFHYTPLDVSACYIPRMFLYYYSIGVPRSYMYELVDEGTDLSNNNDNFGLIDVNHNPKPAYKSLQNLISLLADPGKPIGTEMLSYKVSGSTSNVNHLLLEKRDGTFFLVVWLGMQDFDPNAKVYQWHTPQTVTFNFARSMSNAYLASPNDSNTWSDLPITGNSITLPVQDKVTVLRLRPTCPHSW